MLLHNNEWKLYSHGIVGVYSPSFPKSKIVGISQSSNGVLWLSDEHNLYRWNQNKWRVHCSLASKGGGQFLIEENNNGAGIAMLFGAVEYAGVFEWNRNTIPKRSVTEKYSYNCPIAIGPNDEAIISYQSDYVRVRENGKWFTPPFLPEEMKGITYLKFRSNGDLWIGTRNGLNVYRRSVTRWTSIQLPEPDMRNNINEVIQTRDGNIWLGTGEGVTIIQPNGTLRFVTEIEHSPILIVTGLAEDSEGNVWVSSGSSFNGAYRWDGKEWTHFNIVSDSGFPVHKIHLDKREDCGFSVWVPVMLMSENRPGAFVLRMVHLHDGEKRRITQWSRLCICRK